MSIQDTIVAILRRRTLLQTSATAWEVFQELPAGSSITCLQVSNACWAMHKSGRIKSIEAKPRVQNRHYYVEL